MRTQSILDLLAENKQAMSQKFGVSELAVFGSASRDRMGPGSDIDILVEFSGTPDFDGFMDLKFYLEELLQCKVDLVTQNAIRPAMRRDIQKEAIYVS